MLKMLVLQISLSDERHQIGLFCRPDLELWCRHLIRWSLISAQHFKWIRPMPTRLSTNLIKWWGTPDFSLVCRAHPLWVSGRQLHSTNHVGNYLKDVEKLHWINFKCRRGLAQQLKWIRCQDKGGPHCELYEWASSKPAWTFNIKLLAVIAFRPFTWGFALNDAHC